MIQCGVELLPNIARLLDLTTSCIDDLYTNLEICLNCVSYCMLLILGLFQVYPTLRCATLTAGISRVLGSGIAVVIGENCEHGHLQISVTSGSSLCNQGARVVDWGRFLWSVCQACGVSHDSRQQHHALSKCHNVPAVSAKINKNRDSILPRGLLFSQRHHN